MQIRTCP